MSAPSSRRSKRRTIIAIVAVVGVLVLFIAAWAIDTSRSSGKVPRNVVLLGRSVGGMDEQELRAATAQVAEQYKHAHVRIHSPKGDLDTTAAAIGLALDEQTTDKATLDLGRNDSIAVKPVNWAKSLAQSTEAPLTFTVDIETLMAGLAELDMANRVPPTEPNIAVEGDSIVTVPGVKGQAIDPKAVADQLKAAAATGATPVSIDVTTVPTPPKYSDADARAVADRANTITRNPLALSVGGKSATVQSKTLRTWMVAVPGPTTLDLAVDQSKVVADFPTFIAGLGSSPVDASFTVEHDDAANADVVKIIDAQNGTRCCAADSAERIATALTNNQPTVTLDLEPVAPAHDRAWAEGQKIVEPIATFTTRHPPPNGADRVTNIHLIADTVRGMEIEPGQEFSINDRVGQRTKEKGYVNAPVIYDATHDEDIGGGVSQFATTLFNAAFFGGMDLVSYQSHSLFIDRYPYGREATISWPKPDLKIRNNTPYGILVWTSYTDTSLTVTLYSTKFVTGDQTGQTKEAKGPCTKVTTERTRTWVDGKTEKDNVYAYYQPADGVKCP